MYFFQVGKKYRVITRAMDSNQLTYVPNMFHMFNHGTIVTCKKVIPPHHRMNYKDKLIGEFEDDKGVPQELLPADVEVYRAETR